MTSLYERGNIPQKGHDLKVFFHFNKPHYLALFSLRSFASSIFSRVQHALEKVWDGITTAATWFVNGVKSIVEFFGSVLNFITSLAVAPLVSFIAAIIDVIINALCYMMTTIANSAVMLFKPDIGTGGSIFELILKGYSGLIPFLRTISIAFILIILVSSLAKIIINPQANETPLSVITGAFVAGVLSCCAPFLVVQAEKIFLVFYSGLLSMVPAEVDFEKFASAANTFVADGSASKFGAQMEGLMTSILLLLLLLMIAWKFFMFILEVAQRYLVLGTLLIFSPLACCFITTKSMRNSFKAYIRMVASTLFLMVMNVFFLALFLKSVTGFSDAIASIGAENSSASKIAIVVTWCIVEFGLLYVAGQFDSYLNTMGFSTAETGAGMMASMVMDAIDIGAINPFGSFRGRSKGQSSGFFGRMFSGRQGVVSSLLSKRGAPIRINAGGVDFGDVAQSLRRKTGNKSPLKDGKTASAAARALLDALGDNKLKQEKFDLSNLDIKDGIAILDTAPDKDGKMLTIAFAPLENLPAGFAEAHGGRVIDVPSQGKFVLLATGPNAWSYLAQSSAAEAAFAREYGIGLGEGQVRHVRDGNELTGAYRTTYTNDAGLGMMTEWVPACSYTPDASLNAVKTRVGDMDYWRYNVPVPRDAAGNITATCENTTVPTDASKMQTWLDSQFRGTSLDGYKMVGGTADQIQLEKDGEKYVMSPILSTALTEQAELGPLSHAYANNGADYIMAKVDDFSAESINKVFVTRGAQGNPTFARKIDLDKTMQEALRRRSVNPANTSNILKTAYRKTKGDR